MVEIILDASQLETFEPCPRKWQYSYQENLIPLTARRALDVGSYYHEVLAYYFKFTGDPYDRIKASLRFAVEPKLLHNFRIKDLDERKFHINRLSYYFQTNFDEDLTIKVIAVEQGFSWLLYEDTERRYILEGKIDLVAHGSPYGLFVMDHKTQSRFDDHWEFNHQVCNYLSYTKANYFIYNYIGLQDKLPPKGIRRMLYKPHPGMLEQWRTEVKQTFDYFYECIINGYFPRRRSACDASKYGLCQFHKLCSVPDGSKFTGAVRSAYKIKEEKWKAW